MHRYLFILIGLVCGLTTPLAGDTLDYPLDPLESYSYDSGVIGNAGAVSATKITHVVKMDGSHLIRIYFGETQLEQGSFIRMTSLRDGEVQDLDAAELAMWHDSSAYFNGDAVMVELVAGPKTVNNRFVIDAVQTMYTRPQPVGGPGQPGMCGTDDRVPSNENWTCRLFPAGCTAAVYHTDSCLVSVGHCIGGNMVVQFNVPDSTAGCFTVNPPIADQFPASSFSFLNKGVGFDWAVLTTGTNNLGQMPFERYGELRPISPSFAPPGTDCEVTGYGVDLTCVRTQTQQTSDGPIFQNSSNWYAFLIDATFGNSGSALIRSDTESIIGVVTNCPCPNLATRIDRADFEAAINSACVPEGACCFMDGSCSLETVETCAGSFFGGGSCEPSVCPPLTGACCLSFGCLDSLSQTICEANNGLYIGDGVPCTPDPCVQPCALVGDINEDGSINGPDIGGYTRAKLRAPPEPGENPDCADYGTGTIAGDNALFVDDLLN